PDRGFPGRAGGGSSAVSLLVRIPRELQGCAGVATGVWQAEPMRVAVVAGPDPGHAFPALALCERFLAAGDEPVLFTGPRWFDTAKSAGIPVRRLKGLAPRTIDDDAD